MYMYRDMSGIHIGTILCSLFVVCNYNNSNRLQLQLEITGALTMQSKQPNQNSVHCQRNGTNQ